MNTATKPQGFADTRVSKLRKRIHLPADLQAETHEERFILTEELATFGGTIEFKIKKWLESYNHKAGWSVVYMTTRIACLQAKQIEVILRRHRLGNFILFRVWMQGEQQC